MSDTTRSAPPSRKIASGRAPSPPSRRQALRGAIGVLGGVGAAALAGCDRLSHNEGFVDALKSAESLSRGVHHAIANRRAMAQEFTEADVAAHFKANGTQMPRDADYQALLKNDFADWRLEIGGLVERPAAFTLAELRAMPPRTQITRHDCVEGWSSIGKWTGVPLAHVLGLVQPKPSAKFVLFRCADSMDDPAEGDSRYYESVDLDDALHAQTLLAYELNGKPLPVANGAPLRARIERQLGYKHAKYVMRIELIERFDTIRGGQGGYWEDNGYEWYAGI